MLNSVDYVYHSVLKDILHSGYYKIDRTDKGTISGFGRQIKFNLKYGFPLLTTKKIHVKSVIHELLWFLRLDTNIKYLNYKGVTILNEWADVNGDLGKVYGKQLVDWEGMSDQLTLEYSYKQSDCSTNQIQNLIDRLNTVPDCSSMVVSAWNDADLPLSTPCHYGFQVFTRLLSLEERRLLVSQELFDTVYNGGSPDTLSHSEIDQWDIPKREISLMWNQRSVDVGLGLPFNIASYAFLLHMIAQQVNMVVGELIGNLGDTHLYLNHIEFVEKQLKRESKGNPPKLVLNKAKDIFSYKYEDFNIDGYDPHPNWKGGPIVV